MSAQPTVFESVGGMPFFEALVDRFYDGVRADPVLLPLYPEPEDLGPARHKLTLFLAQYWGGPTTYTRSAATRPCGCDTRRSRSGSTNVTGGSSTCARPSTRWTHRAEVAKALTDYFDMAADSLRNQPV